MEPVQVRFTLRLRHHRSKRCPGRFLDIVGRDPSFSKSNKLHVRHLDIFYLLKLGYILYISFKMIGDFVWSRELQPVIFQKRPVYL